MKKVKKKCQKSEICVIICFVIALVLCIFLITKLLIPYYRIEDRTKKITEYGSKYDTNILGWLRVQGTNIDYPIVFYDDIKKAEADNYSFLWRTTDSKKLTNRPLIFGHNIKNVSTNPLIGDKNQTRFEQLMAYIYPDFVKKNKYIQYTVGGKNYLYKIFSISFTKDDAVDYSQDNFSTTDLNSYIKKAKQDSYFDFDVDVSNSDKIITLVTCTRFFGNTRAYDFKIDARLVRKGERVTNYNFTTKNNYNEIERKIKGDDTNEEA